MRLESGSWSAGCVGQDTPFKIASYDIFLADQVILGIVLGTLLGEWTDYLSFE